jgi:hypothetical protein
MAATHGIGTTLPTDEGKFTPQQIETFQAEDRAGAKSVILLMLSVFSLGLVGSIIVCWQIWK